MSNKSDRITFQTRYNDMLDTLRHEILTSIRPAGEYIPSELALSEQYQISRKSVRKALDILVADGLLTKVPRVGNMVNAVEEFQTITIRLGYYPSLENEAALLDLIDLFRRHYPHIKVEMLSLPYRNYVETVRDFIHNGWVDAVSINNKDFLHAAESGELELFEPQFSQLEHYSFLTSLFTEKEQLYVKPFIFSPIILCYNKGMFARSGIAEPDSSWTWIDLSNAARMTKKKLDTLGFYLDIASLNRFPIYLLQNGFTFEDDPKDSYNGELLWEHLLAFRDLFYNQGESPAFLSEADLDTEKMFLNEKTAMIITSYYALHALKEAAFAYGIAPIPHESEPSTFVLATGLAVSRHSKQKDAAKLLVDFLASEKSQLLISNQTLSIPAHQQAAERAGEEHAHRPAGFNGYLDILPVLRNYKDLNISIHELEHLHSELKLFWSKMEEPDAVKNRLVR
ncbi:MULTISPECIES: extracellular solute-binding protein [unclassified Paenibacillus]|uniref:extracellular solute-binding protein n=1 Tax=unclassified Paenibacillus TaxID=185978 RepID=UPI002F3E5375